MLYACHVTSHWAAIFKSCDIYPCFHWSVSKVSSALSSGSLHTVRFLTLRNQKISNMILFSSWYKSPKSQAVVEERGVGGLRGWGGGQPGQPLYSGGNFTLKCICTKPIGAPIYNIWPQASLPPALPLISATHTHTHTHTHTWELS